MTLGKNARRLSELWKELEVCGVAVCAGVRHMFSSRSGPWILWLLATFSGPLGASKVRKQNGGFLPRPRLIPDIVSNCSGGREKGQGYVKECLEVEKLNKNHDSRGLCIERSGNSHRRRSRLSHIPNFWSCKPSSQWSSRLLGAKGCRGQPNSTMNSLKTVRKRFYAALTQLNSLKLFN